MRRVLVDQLAGVCDWSGIAPAPVSSAVSSGFQDTKLRERSDSVVEPDLLHDLAVLDPDRGRAGNVSASSGRMPPAASEQENR